MVPERQHRARSHDPSARGGPRLAALLLLYAAASLVHCAHDAEFVRDYPNLPASWTRAGVYGAWVAPMARHTGMMNATILSEVTAAALVLVEALRQLVWHSPARRRGSGAK